MSVADSPADPGRRRASLVLDNDGMPLGLAYHRPGEAGYRRLTTFAALYSTQPLIGVLAVRFALPESHAAWSASVATLLLGLDMIVAGPLSDRWGRTRTIKVSLCATAVLGALCAVAPTWPVLLVARAAQGLALAGTPGWRWCTCVRRCTSFRRRRSCRRQVGVREMSCGNRLRSARSEDRAEGQSEWRRSALRCCASWSWSSRLMMRHAASRPVPWSTSSRTRAAMRS